MPRKRFSRIKAAKRLAPAFEAYKQWQDRVDPYTARPAGSRPGGYVQVQVRPFGRDATDLFRVPCSRRSSSTVGELIGARGAAATSTAIRVPGFQPAKAIVFVGTGTATTARSDITNLEYQRRNGASYTHPFGGSTATEKEFEAQAAILTVAAATPNRSVSFTPERMYMY